MIDGEKMIRKRKRKLQKKLIIITSISLLFVMTVGYAAFQTNLTINAKGKIIKKDESVDLTSLVTTTGDGLYLDTYESDATEKRYIYRGANPDNYIDFNNGSKTSEEEKELWRIMALEPDGTLKIIRNDIIGKIQFDTRSGRYSSTGYCNSNQYGCNVWGSKTTMLDSSENNVSEMKRIPKNTNSPAYDLPTEESYLNTYLNREWYNTLDSESKEMIVPYIWNVGLVSSGNYNFNENIIEEQANKWNGKVGLMTAIDLVKASTNPECKSVYNYFYYVACYGDSETHNWLHKKGIFTMSPYPNSESRGIWGILSGGSLNYAIFSYDQRSVLPAVHLKSDIKLQGKGTMDSPYTIIQ